MLNLRKTLSGDVPRLTVSLNLGSEVQERSMVFTQRTRITNDSAEQLPCVTMLSCLLQELFICIIWTPQKERFHDKPCSSVSCSAPAHECYLESLSIYLLLVLLLKSCFLVCALHLPSHSRNIYILVFGPTWLMSV